MWYLIGKLSIRTDCVHTSIICQRIILYQLELVLDKEGGEGRQAECKSLEIRQLKTRDREIIDGNNEYGCGLNNELGAATSSPPMGAVTLDQAHDTINGWDLFQLTHSIDGTVKDVPGTSIVSPTGLKEVSPLLDLKCHCLTSYTTNRPIFLQNPFKKQRILQTVSEEEDATIDGDGEVAKIHRPMSSLTHPACQPSPAVFKI